jgi:outer membrane protein assembly factor BamB
MNFSGKVPRPLVRAARFSFWTGLGCCLLFCLSVRADAPAATTPPTTTNLWTFAFRAGELGDEAFSTPAVAPDGTIYAGTFQGPFHALDADGKEKWKFQAGNEIKSSPAIADDGTVYFGCRDRHFYALTPAGDLKWKFPTGAWVDSSPAIAADGTIYFGSWDKNFYALKPDGSLKWKYPVGAIVDSSPAIAADGTIYFGAHNKKLYALNPAGQQVWTFPTGAEITSSPAIGDDGSIYFSSTDGNLYRVKADGTELWRCRIGGGGDGSPILDENGNVIIAAANRTLRISSTGEIIWQRGLDNWVDETPAAAHETVCFSVPWHFLRGLKPDDTEAWTADTTNGLTASPVIGNHGEIYCACGVLLQAVQPPTALLPSKSSWPMFRANARHTGRVASN